MAEDRSALANLPPPPTGAAQARTPIGVPKDYIAHPQRRVERDALGRAIIPDDQRIVDPSREVHRKDARTTALSWPDETTGKDWQGRTVVADDAAQVGPNQVRRRDVAPKTITSGFDTVAGTVAPRYFDGDQYRPADLPPDQIAALQRRMVDAGVLPKAYSTFGRWDQQSIKAYETLLGYANQAGVDRDEIMQRWKDYGGDDGVPGKVLQVRSPEEIAAVVKQSAGKVLGRSLTAGEVDQLVAGYQSIDRSTQEALAAGQEAASAGQSSTVTEAMPIGTYAEDQIRQRHQGEADWFTGTQRMREFYSMLGEAGSGGGNSG